jgi:hypothetical protein
MFSIITWIFESINIAGKWNMKIDGVVTFLVGPFSGVKPWNSEKNIRFFASLHVYNTKMEFWWCGQIFSIAFWSFSKVWLKKIFSYTLTLIFRRYHYTLSHLRNPALQLDFLREINLRAHPLWSPLRSHRLPFRPGSSNCACLQYCDLAEGAAYAPKRAATSSAASDSSLLLAIASSSTSSSHHQSPPLHAARSTTGLLPAG